MTRKLRISIVDQNNFFVEGLKDAIKKHCLAKGMSVAFMSQQLSHQAANLIFWAPSDPTNLVPVGLQSEGNNKSQLIMVLSQQEINSVKHQTPWVFYRNQSLETLLALVDQALMASVIKGNKKEPEKQRDISHLDILTRRQKQIINYVSEGICPSKIADNLQIHEKTVSSHKRSAMKRLQLNKTTDLYYWILSHSMPSMLENRTPT
ncbi:Response regulator containing a CheY-like receiver domain and an HTH DNA-binding domain [Yersinia mollaretii ATCC 43969]|uniref:Response regulator containing a CheY-like receiver domain and an HTH DNA-binding domain n=1 Tax=Yersinia mollaretii (strain ATCC 43969 / DSM 18520 / CIP 103324 / CNY 7263 / WAIP 204) TaxID=349967 RepID=A0ABP2EBF5_YERMW|nr:LuxR C-terminal-related transcriptional regulator [Yersinia mollaretii]EEQ09759.1 Response regulator containing a CheY-like receiver domain and an HTH DNA-binding domain [Yersinia mollaretii ATCC 43969]QKJ01779.1 response regulator transcription factor [Yersinia mollaretii ATCC 43969]